MDEETQAYQVVYREAVRALDLQRSSFDRLRTRAEEAHDFNRDKHLKPLTNYFRVAISLLTAEIVAWVVDLAIR